MAALSIYTVSHGRLILSSLKRNHNYVSLPCRHPRKAWHPSQWRGVLGVLVRRPTARRTQVWCQR